MKTDTFVFLFLFMVGQVAAQSRSGNAQEFNAETSFRTDTLIATETVNLPTLMSTSNLDLSWDGSHFWLMESLSGKILKLNQQGACVDSFTSIRSSCLEYSDGYLWAISSINLIRIDTATLQPIDTLQLEKPSDFIGAFSCKDLCYLDSAFYSSWSYCWCAKLRLLKYDLRTNLTVDLEDIPLYDNILAMNDTIWGATKTLMPVYKYPSLITDGRKQYIGTFEVSGILYDGSQLVVVDKTNQQLKFMQVKRPTNLAPDNAAMEPVTLCPDGNGNRLSLYVSFSNTSYTVSIFSLDGKCQLSRTLSKPDPVLDISSLPKGQYLISVTSGKDKYRTKFIK